MDSFEPLSNLTPGGSLLGFDRSGALASLVTGLVRILLGLTVLLA
jgi:hypothetical protein